jgi:hypothetical protein
MRTGRKCQELLPGLPCRTAVTGFQRAPRHGAKYYPLCRPGVFTTAYYNQTAEDITWLVVAVGALSMGPALVV